MDVRRTVPVKVAMSESDADLIHETIDEFQWAANYVVRNARNESGYIETGKRRLNDRTYDDVRDATRLHANLVQAARSRAAEALKSVIAKWKRGKKASLPYFTSPFLEYDKRSATFHDDHASLSTVKGRITAEYVLPDESRETPHAQYFFSGEYETTGATLHYRETTDEFYLHVRTKADVDDPDPRENGTVLGVDLGVENIAVTSMGTFWSGAELNHWHREYEKRRASMQQCGTRSAHEAMQRVGDTQTFHFTHLLHQVGNGIVSEAVEGDCSYIAFEKLDGIRERLPNAKWHHKWAFRRVYEYVEYKAAEYGITVEQVNPRNTSRRCTSCGFTAEENRPTQDTFCCQKCGYQTHADYNATKNIGYKLLRRQTVGEGGALVGVRLNTGMMNTNGVIPVPSMG